MPEENFWTLWCKGKLTEADTPTIRLGATQSGLTCAHLHHSSIFLQAGCPSCSPTISVKALKEGHQTCKNPVPLVSRSSFLEEVAEENQEGTGHLRFSCKCPLNGGGGVHGRPTGNRPLNKPNPGKNMTFLTKVTTTGINGIVKAIS